MNLDTHRRRRAVRSATPGGLRARVRAADNDYPAPGVWGCAAAQRLLLAAVLLAAFLTDANRAAVAQETSAAEVTASSSAAPGAGDSGAQSAAEGDANAPSAAAEDAAEIPIRLIERSPFDRVTLNAANGGVQIEVVLIDLPERRVPEPLPESGSLEVRQLSRPTIAYTVEWSAIAKIELFEQMLLEEAQRLSAANEFAEGFEYLAFLAENYPSLRGLEDSLQGHLWREASTAYAAGRAEDAWPVLLALYLRNSSYPRLVNAVQAVSDDLIKQHLAKQDYRAARAVVDTLAKSFRELALANVARWREQFQADAEAQLARARQSLAAKRYREAREAVNNARMILPTAPGGEELWRRIQAESPEVRVGVSQLARLSGDTAPPIWAATRVADLVSPRLVEMVDFSNEGGVYASAWGEIATSEDGLTTTVRLAPAALGRGISTSALALQLAEMGAPQSPYWQEDFAALLRGVRIAGGNEVQVVWRHPHVQPEALMQLPLRRATTAERSPGLWFEPLDEDKAADEQPFRRQGPTPTPGAPQFIVEQALADDEAALAAIMRGDVDVLERVPPWQVARLQGVEGVAVTPYRLPTVHVLIPNYQNPLLELREFRRALCYGIDSASIVRDIIRGGQEQAGVVSVSGPFAVGVRVNDPAGYAYNTNLTPRPYEPRLAALLAGLARTTLAKRAEEAHRNAAETTAQQGAQAAQDGNAASGSAAAAMEPSTAAGPPGEQPTAAGGPPAGDQPATASTPTDGSIEEGEKPPAVEPLVLAHPTDPLCRVVCQTMQLQLNQIGIPCKLVEFQGVWPDAQVKYDLLYAELTAWEPIVDARRVVGSDGVAGRAGALMTSALEELSRSENWAQAAQRLKEIHRIAYYDLPVIPLWQTVNYCAYRRELQGVGDSPVTLYQNVSKWRKSLPE